MINATLAAPPSPTQVRDLRQSSRLLVRALGMINSTFARGGHTPAQCHALIELANRGQLTIGDLASVLGVDKSTASRTVAPLLESGVLAEASNRGDRRTKPLTLTPLGRKKVEQIDAGADTQVSGALSLLSEHEREVVLRGVEVYQQALNRSKSLAAVTIRPIEPKDNPAMAQIIRTVMAEFGAIGEGFSSSDAEVDTMCEAYSGPRSAFFVVERGREVIAGGGIAPLDGAPADVCELRKMYALGSARGFGAGRMLLERCLEVAREHEFRVCYLETLKHMHRAQALYQKFGFQRIDAPMGNTGHAKCDDWWTLEL